MRAFGFLSLLITLGIIGFLMMKQQDPGGEGLNINTAKATELAAQRAAATAALTEVKAAVDTYQKTQEKWPPNLEAVVEAGYLNRIPHNIQYAPETGQVSLIEAPK